MFKFKEVPIVKENILYHGFGFPVLLIGVEFKGEGRGRYLDVPHSILAEKLFNLVLMKPTQWTGSELKFVRKHLELTQQEFASLIRSKNQANVANWEKKNNELTGIPEQTEHYMRMLIFQKISGTETSILNYFKFSLETFDPAIKPEPLEIKLDAAA
jgi:DNA-binding transcriptional regulator YiaG